MQFDFVHCHQSASLSTPNFLLASIVWGGLIAFLVQLEWRKAPSRWKAVVVCVLSTPVATSSIANLLQFPESSSCAFAGRGLLMAVPLTVPFLVLRFLQPRADYAAVAARGVVLLTCLHAWWAVKFFRDDLSPVIEPPHLVGLHIQLAPTLWIAAISAICVALVYFLGERGARVGSWREWIAARLQLFVAAMALAAEVEVASIVTVIYGQPESPKVIIPILLAVFVGIQAVIKARNRDGQATALPT